MAERPRCAVGVPCVGPFGDPRLLVDLAVATEEAGWDGFFLWDHLLWSDPEGHVADPTVVISAVAAVSSAARRLAAACRLGSWERCSEAVTVMTPSTSRPERARSARSFSTGPSASDAARL